MDGYCVRCRAKQQMVNATRTFMKNGRKAMIGTCAACGTKMSVAGKWDEDTEQKPPVIAPRAAETPTVRTNGTHPAVERLITRAPRLTTPVESR